MENTTTPSINESLTNLLNALKRDLAEWKKLSGPTNKARIESHTARIKEIESLLDLRHW